MEQGEPGMPDAIIANVDPSGKRQIFQLLAAEAAKRIHLPEDDILNTLSERERLGSTGVGAGIAIPHGKLEGLDRIFGVLATLKTPIPFDSVDDKPVDIVYMLLAPNDMGAEHLKALGRVSRLLRNAQLVEKLRQADTEDGIRALICPPQKAGTHAA